MEKDRHISLRNIIIFPLNVLSFVLMFEAVEQNVIFIQDLMSFSFLFISYFCFSIFFHYFSSFLVFVVVIFLSFSICWELKKKCSILSGTAVNYVAALFLDCKCIL